MIMSIGELLPDDAVRAALSPERFAEWQLPTQAHFQALARLADANNLPLSLVRQVAAGLNETADASWRIAEDASLNREQKKSALAELAATSRARIAEQLGTLTDSYLRSLRWFDAIAAGTAIKLGDHMIAYRPVDRLEPSKP
jgi:hypothetical protein